LKYNVKFIVVSYHSKPVDCIVNSI